MVENGEHKGIVPFEHIEAEEDAAQPIIIMIGNQVSVTFREDGAAFTFRVGLRTIEKPSGARDERIFTALALARKALLGVRKT